MSCHDMEEEKVKSLEEVGVVPSVVSHSSGWHELLKINYMCDEKCSEDGSKCSYFCTHRGGRWGKPHTINFCRNCNDCRLTDSGDTQVSNAIWKM